MKRTLVIAIVALAFAAILLVTVRLRVPESAIATLPVAEIAALTTKTKPVIFIGLDGGDWQLLDAYMVVGDRSEPTEAARVHAGVVNVPHREGAPHPSPLPTAMRLRRGEGT